jgi:hypothetical protein
MVCPEGRSRGLGGGRAGGGTEAPMIDTEPRSEGRGAVDSIPPASAPASGMGASCCASGASLVVRDRDGNRVAVGRGMARPIHSGCRWIGNGGRAGSGSTAAGSGRWPDVGRDGGRGCGRRLGGIGRALGWRTCQRMATRPGAHLGLVAGLYACAGWHRSLASRPGVSALAVFPGILKSFPGFSPEWGETGGLWATQRHA